MARTPTRRLEPKNRALEAKPLPADPAEIRPRQGQGHRETVEAIAVAFILAMLVRGFEAEAFVIPTGSMAPTLMGRHKEVVCPQCGYTFAVNASEEVEGVPSPEQAQLRRVSAGVCQNCRFQVPLAQDPSFKGDRILVMKFPYELPFLPGSAGPRRWDVVVFRYPEEPEVSYIKRLVGLPGETLKIWYGDIFIKSPGDKDFHLERKPLYHQRAMEMLVYDDHHRPAAMKDRVEWRRWGAVDEGGWVEDALAPGTFRAEGKPGGWTELRYRHLVPDPQQWQALVHGETPPRPPRATLVTDFYSYNSNLPIGREDMTGEIGRELEGTWLQPHWVGDLTLSARVESSSSSGKVRFVLIEGGVSNGCEIDLASGQALIARQGVELGRESTALRGTGGHDVTFANVDNRLTLWIDGRPVFGDGLTYEDDPGLHPEPTEDDLAPARVAVDGASILVSGLVLKRDIYYTQNPGYVDYASAFDTRLPRNPVELIDLLADPTRVASFGPLASSEYTLGDDRYMMLGDNSPRSKDSRGWHNEDLAWDTVNRQRHEVPRSLLTGKAFCVWWPHGKPFGPDIQISKDFRFPFRPYFERFGWIH